jgi:galactonate dehydratase
MPAYANGWYGGCCTPEDFAARARDVAARGYRAMKFDPFTTAWKALSREEEDGAVEIVRAVADAVGPKVGLMIEIHGRLGPTDAIRFIRRLEGLAIHWCEEPVDPAAVEMLCEVKDKVRLPISSGERLYAVADFARLLGTRAVDIVQMDVAHCGGITVAKKIAAMAEAQEIGISPHCSVGPVALAAALHVAWSCRNMTMLESFAEFDVPWRADLVGGWNLLKDGMYGVPERPGLGLDPDPEAILRHPYRPLAFPSLWDETWLDDFTGNPDVPATGGGGRA